MGKSVVDHLNSNIIRVPRIVAAVAVLTHLATDLFTLLSFVSTRNNDFVFYYTLSGLTNWSNSLKINFLFYYSRCFYSMGCSVCSPYNTYLLQYTYLHTKKQRNLRNHEKESVMICFVQLYPVFKRKLILTLKQCIYALFADSTK